MTALEPNFASYKCGPIYIQFWINSRGHWPIDSKAALVQVMTWRRTGNKSLPEPMLAQFTNVYAVLGGDKLTYCTVAH